MTKEIKLNVLWDEIYGAESFIHSFIHGPFYLEKHFFLLLVITVL